MIEAHVTQETDDNITALLEAEHEALRDYFHARQAYYGKPIADAGRRLVMDAAHTNMYHLMQEIDEAKKRGKS